MCSQRVFGTENVWSDMSGETQVSQGLALKSSKRIMYAPPVSEIVSPISWLKIYFCSDGVAAVGAKFHTNDLTLGKQQPCSSMLFFVGDWVIRAV